MFQRARFTQTESLEARLASEAIRLRKEAEQVRHGPARDQILRKARQAETGSHMSSRLRSSELRSPK
jgi:hypothetical protein